ADRKNLKDLLHLFGRQNPSGWSGEGARHLCPQRMRRLDDFRPRRQKVLFAAMPEARMGIYTEQGILSATPQVQPQAPIQKQKRPIFAQILDAIIGLRNCFFSRGSWDNSLPSERAGRYPFL